VWNMNLHQWCCLLGALYQVWMALPWDLWWALGLLS
jgi:hypothetical protein